MLIKIYAIIFLLYQLLQTLNGYKLNVPRVLLPFHSSKLISFTLEAKGDSENQQQDLCFVWSTSKPDIVTITPIYDQNADARASNGGGGGVCSSKAIVSAVSKHAQRLTSIILAKEIKTDKIIRCDVIVDQISSVRIRHTTTHLFLEDSPECFTVEALDAEGNTFSSLEGLPFEWSIINDASSSSSISMSSNQSELDSRNVLRISKFIHSEYQVTETIKQLERDGQSGHKILIEGLKTGTANVQAKLIDSFYKDTLKTPLVHLLVVANILLDPIYPVYLLPGSLINYSVYLIKQTSIEKINLPSTQYYFESNNASVATIVASEPSTIVGVEVGSTEIVLIDRNMKDELKLFARLHANQPNMSIAPPTALVHVVQPDHLEFLIRINGIWQENRSPWILESGKAYELMILAYTDQHKQIYPSENLRIDSQFDTSRFDVERKSINGSYLVLKAMQKGLTQLKATLSGTITNAALVPLDISCVGEQDVEILDPITVQPDLIVFALTPPASSAPPSITGSKLNVPTENWMHTTSNAYEMKIRSFGGSNSCDWKSMNTTVASVNNRNCLCSACSIRTTATQVGHSTIVVTDTRNIDIQARADLFVLEPVDIQLQPCPTETNVGTRLFLNIQMNALLSDLLKLQPAPKRTGSLVPINDCSRLKFDVEIDDATLFRFVSIQSPSSIKALHDEHPVEGACAVIVLDALSIGRTTVKITADIVTLKLESTPSMVKLTSANLLIGSYAPLKSFRSRITLTRGASFNLHVYDGPLQSSLVGKKSGQLLTDLAHFHSIAETSEPSCVSVKVSESDYQPNRYTYRISCVDSAKCEQNKDISVRVAIAHKKSSVNACPVKFEHQVRVRCAMPTALTLKQLFVNNEDNTGNNDSNFKSICPISLNSNLIMAHIDRPLFVQLEARDAYNNVFDNFTTKIDWNIEEKSAMRVSANHPRMDWIETIVSENVLKVLADDEEVANSQRLFYQQFELSAKWGQQAKLQAFASLDEKTRIESNSLEVHFVSDVKVKPESLIIFNHPSNVETLDLKHGSGYYHAEVEVTRRQPDEQQQQQEVRASSETMGNNGLIKINHISELNILVSPLANGFANLNIYDYCVPPRMDQVPLRPPTKQYAVRWSPSATSKIEIAGINSIFVRLEDDKVEINGKLKIYVQISDSAGHLIQTKYFPLMNLKHSIANTVQSLDSGNSHLLNDKLASIELATAAAEDPKSIGEHTAVYVLEALKEGFVTIQFEAEPDQVQEQLNNGVERKATTTSTKRTTTIKSQLKDIQIYAPLNAQPKYIELIVGANYQITTSGGPSAPEIAIKYETDDKSKQKIVDIASNGVLDALSLGKVKIVVKSMGESCPPRLLTTVNSALDCNEESKKLKVYSQDHIVVKVVQLHSIHIHAPLASIKQGNEMPIYLLGNDHSLTPLNFGSCSHLKYSWKINDPQVGSLYHSLLSPLDSLDSLDQANTFESAFSLRFLAHQAGTVKVTVRVEARHGHIFANGVTHLTDTIDIKVVDNAMFMHFPPAYFGFKYQLSKASMKTIEHFNIRQYQTILMTPGATFQVQTNLDKSAVRIDYQLTPTLDSSSDPSICTNRTISVTQGGLIRVEKIAQHQLKKLHRCTAHLLVTVHGDETSEQVLSCTINVKPVAYTLVKLKKNSIRFNSLVDKVRVKAQSLIKNKMSMSSSALQMKWHVQYHDDLGDLFDVVFVGNEYVQSRVDLADLSQLNKNIFTLGDSNLESRASFIANAAEHSFSVRTIKAGRLVISFTPTAFDLKRAKDFLGLHIADNVDLMDKDSESYSKSDSFIGDFICLAKKSSAKSNDDEDYTDDYEDVDEHWSVDSTDDVVRLVGGSAFAVCFSPGHAMLKRSSPFNQQNPSKIVELNVRPIDKVNFLLASLKSVSNSGAEHIIVPFQINNNQDRKRQQQQPNCSQEFEQLFNEKAQAEMIPFKCTASIYGDAGQSLHQMDKLVSTTVSFVDNNWSCKLTFVADSKALLYDLMLADTKPEAKCDDEPTFVKISVETKRNDLASSSENELLKRAIKIPFMPAFHVKTKQIEITILRNNIYAFMANRRTSSGGHLQTLHVLATRQIEASIQVSTNCPALIKINRIEKGNNECNAISYEIVTPDDQFDLALYATLLQQNMGFLFVHVQSSLTKQSEKIPVKFTFVNSDHNKQYAADFSQHMATTKNELNWLGLFDWCSELTPNQFISLCLFISIIFMIIIFILKQKSPGQLATEQIALNASAAATAAMVAASNYSFRDKSSFNPYRYSSSPSSDSSYLMSPTKQQQQQTSPSRTAAATTATINRSPRGRLMFNDINSPQPSLINRQQTPFERARHLNTSFNTSSPLELSDRVNLFSTTDQSIPQSNNNNNFKWE